MNAAVVTIRPSRATHTPGRRAKASHAAAAAVLVLLGCFAPPADAYLDPGTGSIILQGIIAGVAAAITWVGFYWQKVKAFFGRSAPPARTDDAGDEKPRDDHGD
jgi:hypothetical protein